MVALGGDAGAAVMRPGAISWRKAIFPWRRKRGMQVGIEVGCELTAWLAAGGRMLGWQQMTAHATH
jgi:hypothetical protein